jgi:hypothetical protein
MGCNKSKETSQPGKAPNNKAGVTTAEAGKDGMSATSPEKRWQASQNATPAKSPMKGIKEISAEQLKKQKPADLISFCK